MKSGGKIRIEARSNMEDVISQDCAAIITYYCGNDTTGVIKININLRENHDSFSLPASAGLQSVSVPCSSSLLLSFDIYPCVLIYLLPLSPCHYSRIPNFPPLPPDLFLPL